MNQWDVIRETSENKQVTVKYKRASLKHGLFQIATKPLFDWLYIESK